MVGRAVPHLSVVGSRWAVVTPCSECVDEREDFSADLTHLVSYSVVRVTQAQWSSSVQPYAQQRVRGSTRPVARAERCVTGRVVFQHVVLLCTVLALQQFVTMSGRAGR
jgi:hypothetical protein